MKRTNIFRTLLVLALTIVLCLGTATTAFAAGNPIIGTESEPAQAAITKILQMPEGTTTPTANFEFEIAPVSLDGDTTASVLATMPTVGTSGVVTIPFTNTDVGNTASGIKTVPLESSTLFEGLTWPKAGIYIYSITENSGTYNISDTFAEQMTYSSGKYNVAVYVANGNNNLYVAAIGALIEITDNSGQNQGDKVDPTPGGDPLITGDYSKMIFTNTYLKNNGGGEDPDVSALNISKTVTGDLGDLTKYFAFEVTVTKAAFVSGTPTYPVYVMDSTGIVTTTNNYVTLATDSNGKNYIAVTANTTITINLKHGQWLAFSDAHVGTSYTVNETAATDYTPAVSIVVAGASPVVINGTISTALSTGTRLIGDGANSVAYTNAFKTVTPTGISLNNLPYIMILVLAGGLLVAYVVVKFRKRTTGK